MSRPHTPLPAWSDEPFRAKDAAARGVGKGRLRGRDLARPYRGVRSSQPVGETVRERCAAYGAVMAPGQFFSHRTAARIYGLPIPGFEESEPLHVTVFRPDRAPRMDGIVGHHTTIGTVDVEIRDGLFVASPAHTLAQLATGLSVEQLVIVGDALVGGRNPLCTRGDLERVLGRSGGNRGVEALREAVPLVRVGSESPQETRLRLLLMAAGLPEPHLNMDVFDGRGAFVARGDLVYPDQRVIIEYDGDQHRTDRRQFERDVDRLEALAGEAWRVLRVLSHHLDRPDALVARVRAALF